MFILIIHYLQQCDTTSKKCQTKVKNTKICANLVSWCSHLNMLHLSQISTLHFLDICFSYTMEHKFQEGETKKDNNYMYKEKISLIHLEFINRPFFNKRCAKPSLYKNRILNRLVSQRLSIICSTSKTL